MIRRDLFGHMGSLYAPAVNESVLMECVALGEPRPLITWAKLTEYVLEMCVEYIHLYMFSYDIVTMLHCLHRDGLEPVLFSDRVEPLVNGSLWFISVIIADAGMYRCTAINELGYARLYYNLLVHGKCHTHS